MALEHATAQQRMGQAAIRRLSNASLVPDGYAAVEGVFQNRPVNAAIGQAGLQGREVSFRAICSELPAELARGMACSVFVGAQRVMLNGRYAVRHREDYLLIDTAVLDLELTA